MSRRPSLWTRGFRPRLHQLEGREVPAFIYVDPAFTGSPGGNPAQDFNAAGAGPLGSVSRTLLTFVASGTPAGGGGVTGAGKFAVPDVTTAFNSARDNPGADTILLAASASPYNLDNSQGRSQTGGFGGLNDNTYFFNTDPLSILGSGKEVSVIAPQANTYDPIDPATAADPLLAVRLGGSFVGSDFHLTGNGKLIGVGIGSSGGSSLTLTNLAVDGFTAVAGTPAQTGFGFGVAVSNTAGAGGTTLVTNSGFTSNASVGLSLENASGQFVGSSFAGNGADGVRLGGDKSDLSLTGCDFFSNGRSGLVVSDVDPNTGIPIQVEVQLSVTGCTFTDNGTTAAGGTLSNGGAINIDTSNVSSKVTVADSTFRNNKTAQDGGAIYSAGPLTVTGSLFDGNTAAGSGGGLFVAAGPAVRVSNSTLTGNVSGGNGAGLAVGTGTPDVVLTGVTILKNSPTGFGGGVYNPPGNPSVRLVNSIVGLNFSNTGAGGPDLFGRFAGGVNLVTASSGGTPDAGSDFRQVPDNAVFAAQFGGLAVNGGPTQTFALLAGNPALGIGAVAPAVVNPPSDQRGRARPAAGPIDLGAFQHQRPTAAADGPFRVAPLTPLTLPAATLLANDQRFELFTALTAVLVGQPAAGTGSVVQNPDGSFTFTAAAGYSGPAVFTYQASDGVTRSAPATVSLTVAPVVPPTAAADSFTVPPGAATRLPVLANDTLGTGPGPLTAALVTPPVAGTGSVVLNPDGSFTFTPAAGYSGLVRFTYAASDGTGTSAPAAVDLTVTAPGGLTAADRPGYKLDLATATTLTVAAADGLLAGLTAPNGGLLRVAAVTPGFGLPAAGFTPAAGNFVVDPATGAFTLTLPPETPSGPLTFTYTVTDGLTTSAPATATVTVSGGRPATVARFTAYGSGAGTPGVVRVVRPLQADLVLRPFEASFQGGVRVAVADLTGDGVDDVVVGAGPGGGPRVVVFDGARSTTAVPVVVANFYAFNADFRGGAHVAAADTVTPAGSRTAILVVGAGSFADQPGSPRVVGFVGLGNVPTDGSVAARPNFSFMAYAANFQGGVRVAVGDLKGTGTFQIVTVPGPSGGPNVKIWDAGTPDAKSQPTLRQSFAGLGDGAGQVSYRGGAFVAVSGGVLVVTPDSLPAFANTLLDVNSGSLPDASGTTPGRPTPSAANTSTPPAVRVYVTPQLLGQPAATGGFVDETQAAEPSLGDVTFTGGIRPAVGQPGGGSEQVVLLGYGPGRDGQVRQVRLTPQAIDTQPTSTAVASGRYDASKVLQAANELAGDRPLFGLVADPSVSVYVGLAPVRFTLPASTTTV